ncbi:nicotinamide mononucleotide transporter [Fructilactobacillus fructivorans]|uniref:Nicotinamide mononucleotide transporter n=1 Tax=Fructilactobacillus fructivorans TaxID=1614 RepID=A0AAE6P3N4_9LACO|nr:nicotinamide mononucleotide transporter [Fructilactobacillus fructivorans]KRK56887.1 hypothetical protein FC73_GL001279 [Fructilactobacillus fructivorans]KRN13165.1 hypothetical protein IV37_GL000805 [Fructilactobacillus fructivorans]KRN41249.1 hypothetical protein IV51_GL000568 [Fructilactobacillus fructivorans]KRN43064.1 hypothetical protein IV48_GL000871 [Fructilactobacillus fructivorans]QFX93257.1 hypothetical protein LF543_06780 [Fructilactobacillus fructivorans]
MWHALAKSKWFDLIGVGIVVVISIASGYLTENLADVTHWGGWAIFVPFGMISIVNSILSIYSTRLTGRMNNLGNIIGLINVVLSAFIDYVLGNKAAVVTYPVTFIIYTFAINKWMKTKKYQASRPFTGAKKWLVMTGILLGSFLFSFAANLVGWPSGFTHLLFWIVVIAFDLSLSANILNAMKLTVQWKYWFIYNLIQFLKAVVQGNFANVGKYIYYIINSIAALDFWEKPILKSSKIE